MDAMASILANLESTNPFRVWKSSQYLLSCSIYLLPSGLLAECSVAEMLKCSLHSKWVLIAFLEGMAIWAIYFGRSVSYGFWSRGPLVQDPRPIYVCAWCKAELQHLLGTLLPAVLVSGWLITDFLCRAMIRTTSDPVVQPHLWRLSRHQVVVSSQFQPISSYSKLHRYYFTMESLLLAATSSDPVTYGSRAATHVRCECCHGHVRGRWWRSAPGFFAHRQIVNCGLSPSSAQVRT